MKTQIEGDIEVDTSGIREPEGEGEERAELYRRRKRRKSGLDVLEIGF